MMPERLEVRDGGRLLRIIWPDGRAETIGAALLRAECRSAGARRARIDGIAPPAGDVRITAIELVGAYAANIAFSDGQDRGIYPWPYLADLAQRETAGAEFEPLGGVTA